MFPSLSFLTGEKSFSIEFSRLRVFEQLNKLLRQNEKYPFEQFLIAVILRINTVELEG